MVLVLSFYLEIFFFPFVCLLGVHMYAHVCSQRNTLQALFFHLDMNPWDGIQDVSMAARALTPESSCRPDLYQSVEVTRLTVLSSSNFVIKVKEIWVLILLKAQQCRKFGGRRRYNKNGRSPRVERISLLQSSLPTLASRKSYCQDFRIFIFIFRPPLQDYGNNFQKTGLTLYLPVL